MLVTKNYKVTDLIKALNHENPRVMSDYQRTALGESMERFGCVEPILLNLTTNQIIGGHQRVMVAQEKGIKSLPVVELEIPADKEIAFNIALNKIKGGWDYSKLGAILSDIDPESLGATGFEDNEVAAIVNSYNADLERLAKSEDLGDGVVPSFSNKTDEEVIQEASSTVKIQFGLFNVNLTAGEYEAWVDTLREKSSNGDSPAALGAVVAEMLGLKVSEEEEEGEDDN